MPAGSSRSQDSIAVIGMACRLPGAAGLDEYWSLLLQERCSVSEIGSDRWAIERFYHPRRGEPGRSYTLAAGLIEAPNGFDAGAFRIAPREAEQMDPQQRLLLELVWEALEDAGLPPSTLAGQPVGVFVGASSVDAYTRIVGDASGIDTHFMTGNTASIIANRISYIYDLRGPSLTIDTACSSSLVALDAAVRALARGEIDTAVVAGVNILGAPQAFYGFSRAGMLSPTGLCRPFAAAADGYVRAEGGAVLVLSRLDAALSNGRPPRVMIDKTGVNSDGRTVGLSLPSTDAQRRLLERLYGEAGIDPNDLAFVEAHGTGTRVGDPAEAEAIGRALGQKRDAPLPVGSVKSNIGHLEPASGLAGTIKAILAIEHRVLPATLHLDTINPDIPFDALNLVPARGPVALPPGPLTAGVSSFGFGGTNAHAVLRAPRPDEMPDAAPKAPARALLLSAHGEEALRSLAGRYAEALERADAPPARIARHAAHERELLAHRLALPLSDDAAAQLRRFAEGDRSAQVLSARGEGGAVCFAFSGNGSQFVGMGLRAYRASRPFRDAFDEVDARYAALAGWSLAKALQDPALDQRLPATSTAQPLLFAVQAALTAALAAEGLEPAMVIGHSVGEVAAALAAGMVSLDQAVRIIHWRSRCQEQLRGLGTMAVLMLGREEAEAMLAEAGLRDTVVAAVNSPVCVTVSGPADQIEALLKLARQRRVATQRVGVDYPFHSPLTAPIEAPLKAALADTASAEGRIPFISAVTGAALTGAALDAEYWWRNIRQPVDFAAAARTALELGAGIFVEIGPRPVLTGHLRDIAKAAGREAAILPTLDNKAGDNKAGDNKVGEDGPDPVERAVLQVLLRGGAVDRRPLFGDRPTGRRQALPHYPWQRRDLRQAATPERIDLSLAKPAHPLLGARLGEGTPEWHSLLDPELLPYLADHKVAGEVVVPGAALLEMAVAAGRQWFGAEAVEVEDFDIVQAVMIAEGTTRETWLRLAPTTGAIEILGRQRMAGEEWTLHARGRVGPSPAAAPERGAGDDSTLRPVDPAAIYAAAASAGIDYGPAFRRAAAIASDDEHRITVDLAPEAADNGLYTTAHALHPTALDAAFHGLFALYERLGGGEGGAFLPVRFASLRVYQSLPAVRARLDLRRATARSILVDIALEDEAGMVVAELRGARFQRSALRLTAGDALLYRAVRQPWDGGRAGITAAELEQAVTGLLDRHEAGDDWLLLTAWARSMAHRAVRTVAGSARFTVERLCRGGRLASAAVPRFAALLKVLAEFGLATEEDGAWRLAPARLPSPQAILRSILAAHPERGAETVMAARLSRDLVAALRSGEPLRFSKGVEAHARAASPLLPLAAELVGRLTAGRAMPLALLLVDPEGELVPALLPLIRSGALTVAVTGPELKVLAGLAARSPRLPGLRILDEQTTVPTGRFDLALSVGTMAAGDSARLGQQVSGLLRPGAAAVTIDTIPDTVTALLLDGTAEGVTSQDGLAGLRPAARHRIGTRGASAQLVVWDRPAVDLPAEPAGPILIRPADTELLADLADRLRGRGHAVRIDPAAAAAEGDTVLLPLMLDAARDPVAFLTRAILAVRAEAEALPAKSTLWLVARCGKLNGKADGGRGLAEALAAFARTLANEYSGSTIRFATLAPALPDGSAAVALAGLIGSAETEVEIDRDGIFVSRVEAVRSAPQDAPAEDRAARLALAAPGSLGRIGWAAAERRAPGPEEIEIEVAASGLNFRDVMFSLGLLPDDYLEDGFAGPTLGFECAGTVRRVGAAVTDLREGDRVMAFAPAAFATHVTIPAQVAMRVPEGVDLTAAATMPVAFITAWYALVHQARLGRGESVLIHGAAGGVGLAALQIAKLRGATVVATAGNEDKRALAQLLGADLVLDSRSLAFADEIRWKLGGVDVVLNSLSGDAMRRSLRALKPFGRFVELGKRDFVADTAVGLRAFARNVSYFGVDADQLLNAQPGLTRRLLRELDRLFAQRRLTPLAHRVFPADQAEDAFRLMQGAGHIGKVVITPPREIPAALVVETRFEAQDSGFHLVAGGTGGFGFATALWLAEHGAKTIVVASRRGTLGPAEKAEAERLAKQGVTLVAERLDVTDRAACEKLLAGLERRHGPLRGIIHAAMVLDDGLLRDLDAARIERVLAPKIKGAIHLDLVSRTRAPDYFVLFSSATTLIGNPGQANYVAANAYLEALARTRRAQGLPALAVSWGAIADAGVLARDAAKGDALKRRIGRSSLKAAEALAQLGRLLARPAETEAVVACARIDWQAATRELPILATPRLASMADGRRVETAEAEVDLAAMIDGRTDAEAQGIVTETMLGEIGRILRMPPADIDPDRAFAELGMDSLMGLELDAAMQGRYGIDLPFLSIGAGLTLTELSTRIVAKLRGGAPAASPEAQPPAEAVQLIARHVEADLEADAAVLVREAVRDRAKTTRRVLG